MRCGTVVTRAFLNRGLTFCRHTDYNQYVKGTRFLVSMLSNNKKLLSAGVGGGEPSINKKARHVIITPRRTGINTNTLTSVCLVAKAMALPGTEYYIQII